MTNLADQSRIDELIAGIGERLTGTIGSLIDAIPGGPHRPQELSRVLGINKDLSSRVLNAFECDDPIAAVHQLPGPVPLRRLVKAVVAKGVRGPVLTEAGNAIDEFEVLIRDLAGDRASLDAIISAWLPESRERIEAVNRQLVYRGMAQFKGVSVDATINTAVLYPSADGVHLDGVWIIGFRSMRRIRPGTPIRYASRRLPDDRVPRAFTLSGSDVTTADGLLLNDYCSDPLPEIRAEHSGSTVHYMLVGNEVGLGSAVDIFFAEHTPACIPRFCNPDSPTRHGPVSEILLPTKLLIFDAIIHDDAFRRVPPELIVYDMGNEGVANMNDRSRDIDRIRTCDVVKPIGQGLGAARIPELRRYTSLVRDVLGQLGLDEQRFRAFRCRSQYPVHGTQYSLAFEPEYPQDQPNRT